MRTAACRSGTIRRGCPLIRIFFPAVLFLFAGGAWADDQKPNRIERGVNKVEKGVKKTAERTGNAIERGAKATERGAKRTVDRTENWVNKRLE